jgi:hypothetical protein
MSEWPNAWLIDGPDLAYGQALLEEVTPFVTHLISVEHLSTSTIRRHLDYLFLLGGELISHINIFERDRRLSPSKLLDRSISEDGRPLCKHIEEGHMQAQYDATCRKLHAFRSSLSRQTR